MQKNKTTHEVEALAHLIRERRRKRLLTLKEIEKETGINCGQLSRFERGQFRFISRNLQKLCKFLEIDTSKAHAIESDFLSEYAIQFIEKSPIHRAVLEELLPTLDRIVDLRFKGTQSRR